MKINFTKNLFLLFALLSSEMSGWGSLYFQHPRETWKSGQGTFEEALLTVRPNGIYMEYNLYLTISAKGYHYPKSDSLEIIFDFDLPETSLVTDLWLWIGNDIMKAYIFDKWKASTIYENIVKRRRDPAILYKESPTHYLLRVYPLPGDESRKVKITFLSLLNWSTNVVSAQLPTDLLLSSNYPLNNITLITYPGSQWTNPAILEDPNIKFTSAFDTTFGNYSYTHIPNTLFYSSTIAYQSPMHNGVFVDIYNKGSENYYQMAFVPTDALKLKTPKKTVVLIDYDISKTNITSEQILSSVKTMLIKNFGAGDSVNLILSKLNVYRVSNSWVPANADSIENLFSKLSSEPFSRYSNLIPLVTDAIDFIKSNGNNGTILLVSSSDQYGNYLVANPIISDIQKLLSSKIRISIADFANINLSNNWFGERYYWGNEYFFMNLSKISNGNYLNIRNISNISTLLNNISQLLNGTISSFDLYTTLQNGFCYGKININYSLLPSSIGNPIFQVGKYSGELPFRIEAAGIFNSHPFSQTFEIPDSQIVHSDSVLAQIWAGNYIKSLENNNQTNDIMNEIITSSIYNRVLTIYTSFLCLEPNDTIKVCTSCSDEGIINTEVKSDEINYKDTLEIKVYPNPFNSQTKILVSIPSGTNTDDLSMSIFNILGQEIRTYNSSDYSNQRSFQLIWDGKDNNGQNASSGIYLFVAKTSKFRQAVKLLLLK